MNPKINSRTYQRIEELELRRIITDRYQRPVNRRRVEKIAAAFDPAKIGVLLVNRRADNTYAILDGQHRLAAMRAKGITFGMAVVLEGLSLEEEADYFRRQCENVAKLSSLDLYKAGLVAGDASCISIECILTRYGFKVHRTSGPRRIIAVATLERIAGQFGFPVLDRVLSYVAAAWPTDPMAVRRDMLAGFTEFVLRFGKEVTPEQFGALMRNKLPSDLFFEHRRRMAGTATARNAFDPSVRYALCAVIVETFNRGLSSRSQRRLTLTWDGPRIDYDEAGLWH